MEISKKEIRNEGERRCGRGQKGVGFELGAEYILGLLPRINSLAHQAYETAVLRGKTSPDALHLDTFFGIFEELKEFNGASEIEPSEHLPHYTQSVEELADLVICGFTELHARGVDVEQVIIDKINFNKTR